MGARGLEGFRGQWKWKRKADDGARDGDGERERQRSSYVYETHVVSTLSAGRAVITGRRQRNPDRGKKSGDAQTAGLPPLGPQHNHNVNQPIV